MSIALRLACSVRSSRDRTLEQLVCRLDEDATLSDWFIERNGHGRAQRDVVAVAMNVVLLFSRRTIRSPS